MIGKEPFFSIIIPTLNEEKYLPKLLDDLTQQSYQDFEVIVIDGHSEDKTLGKADLFVKKLDLTVRLADRQHVSAQRNQGAKLAQGKWLLFMDADNRLPKYFLDGIRYRIAKNPRIMVFTTWILPDKISTYNQSVARMINLFLEISKSTSQKAALGAFIACHQKVFAKNEFDETQKICEDYQFVRTASKKGFRFAVFRDPQYHFSFRRIRKEGTFKMLRAATMVKLKDLQGGDFSSRDYGYVMNGGKYYDQAAPSVLSDFYHLLQTASKKQLLQIKELLTTTITIE
jgi:glycosyltransferase involved in cell wall biosynthesis